MIYTNDVEKIDAANVEEISAADSLPVDSTEKIDATNVEEISADNSSPVDSTEKIDTANVEEISAADSTPVDSAEKVDVTPVEEISAAQVDPTPINPLDVKGFQIVVPDLGSNGNTFNRKIEGSSSEVRVLGNASAPKQERVFVTTREISEDEVPPEIREAIRRKEEQRARSAGVSGFVNAGVNARFAATDTPAVELSDEEIQRRDEAARIKSKLLVDKILKGKRDA